MARRGLHLDAIYPPLSRGAESGFEAPDERRDRDAEDVAHGLELQNVQAAFSRLILAHEGLDTPEAARKLGLTHSGVQPLTAQEAAKRFFL